MKLPKMRKIAGGGGNLSGFVIAAAVCVATAPSPSWGDSYYYNTKDGTANLGPETQIDSRERFIVRKGTVNVNEGASIKSGGNASGSCNFIGVDESSPAAVNINGGTLWFATSNGSGYLGVGNNDKAQTSTLTLNRGLLRVDTQLRSAVMYDDSAGATSSGTITINGGEAIVKQLVIGAKKQKTNCGTSTVVLNGGRLTVEEIYFRPYNGQVFTWNNGKIVAARADIFRVDTYADTKSRTMQITGTPAVFDTAGFHQTIPAFTAASGGRLWIKGGGTVAFENPALPYYLHLGDVTVDLGTLDAASPALTTPGLEIVGPVTLNVTLPESPSGRYALISCNYIPAGSPAQITVAGGGAGKVVIDGTAVYLSFEDDADALVYSDAAGGSATFAEATGGTSLTFGAAAGSYTIGGAGLTLSQGVSDLSTAAQTVSAPVTLSTTGASLYVAEGGTLELSGGLSANTPLKVGPGTLVLSGATRPASINLREGELDFGGGTYSGTLRFYMNDAVTTVFDRSLSLANGTCTHSGNLNFKGATLTVRDDLTFGITGRLAVGYGKNFANAADYTAVVIDGGTMTTVGDSSSSCNFVAVDQSGTGVLEVVRGSYSTTKYLRIAAGTNPYVTGIVRVRGGTFRVDGDLTMATVYNGTGGGAGTARFELSGGTASIGNFYLGGTSSSTGSGTVNLTGGVLEVGVLKCLAYNTQTLLADGATIRAKRDDTASAPFMAKVASADGYAKSYTIGSDGLTVDTAGYDVHCDIPWTGEGGLTIMGGGSLALGAPPTFTGDVVISNATTLVVTNSATFAGTISFLGADSKIRIDTTSYTEDSMTIATDGFTLPSGVTDVLNLVELVGDGYVASVSADGKSIELGLAANVAAFAWWTGGGDPTDFDDPANWACTNSTGGVVANALPVKSTVVVLSGTTSFTVPAGTTPVWVTTQVGNGNGGAVTLGADCDWSAAPNLTIADGSHIDLHGHNLKISYLTAAEGENGAYVTNSVAGTKPALWAENVFSEKKYIDTEKVTVYTDFLEVKSVNDKTFTIANQGLGWSFDAGLFVTNGTTTVTGDSYPGRYGHTATISVSGNASLRFQGYTHFRGGVYDDSGVYIFVTNNATFSTSGYITIGHHNSGPALFRQDGGTVSLPSHLNLGVGNTSTARYEITAGTLTVGDSFVIGRLDNYEGNVPGIGMFVQSGGTVNANKYLSIGWNNGSEGAYVMSGGEFFISANRANLGSELAVKMGLWDISGGTATTTKGLNVARASGSTAKLRLSGSGTLVTADITGDAGASTVEFDGGTLAANADNAAFIKGITNVVFGANAVTLDTAGHNLGITNCVLKATPGARAITLTGGGTLDFTNATLDFTGPLTRGFVLAQVADGDAATFTGVPALAPGVRGFKVKLYADGKTIKVLSKGCVIIVK